MSSPFLKCNETRQNEPSTRVLDKCILHEHKHKIGEHFKEQPLKKIVPTSFEKMFLLYEGFCSFYPDVKRH